MVRVLLALWLAAFSVQTTDLVALVAPDGCTEETRGSSSDPCDDGCPRCLCCARAAVFIPQALPPARTDIVARPIVTPSSDSLITAIPRGIFHVPKSSLS